MIAEKASDLILGLPPLPAERVAVWQDPEWRTRQRVGAPARRLDDGARPAPGCVDMLGEAR
jgi:hypothetical protein